jgi:tripartite-type tricarboxylate transporter receptor subunit TctC
MRVHNTLMAVCFKQNTIARIKGDIRQPRSAWNACEVFGSGEFMLKPCLLAKIVSGGIVVLGAAAVYGQDYPNKPMRIITAAGGGATDVAARLIAQGLAGGFGQPVVVENRPSSLVGEIVAKAPPDGYTLLVVGSAFVIGPLLQKTSYDPLRDFSPISLTSSSPNILVVHPSLPVKSVKELIALARARPGELNYGSGPAGSSPHLAAELLKSMAGVNIVRISYKGGGPAVIGLIGGEVQLMISPAGSVSTNIKSGKLRALAVTSAQPSALLPGLPTVAATGVPGYESSSLVGMLAPAGTPETISNRLNQEIVRVLNRVDVKEKFLNAGLETIGSSPGQFAATMKSEIAKWGKVIKGAGIKDE